MRRSFSEMVLIGLAFLFSALPVTASGQGFPYSPSRARKSPYFHVDTAFFISPGTEYGKLEIFYDIPYSQLQFLKRRDSFVARFEVQAILYDSKRRQVGGDSWRRTVTSASYRETVSPDGSFHETFELRAKPGKHTLLVRTENLDPEEESSVLLELDIGKVRHFPALSELVLGLCSLDSSSSDDYRSRVIPHPSRRYGERFPRFCVYGEVYDDLAPKDTSVHRLIWRILDEKGSVESEDTLYVAREGRASPFLLSSDVNALTMGRYTLELVLGEGREAQRARKVFEVDESKFAIDEDIDDTLDLLGYIAGRSEIEPIREAEGEERKRLWMEFWKRRDPYPGTPENEYLIEFFERVRYANNHFSSIDAGWKTDRGRIYIRRGPPDQVERRPMSPSGPAYEIWSYYEKGLTFVFVDRMGFGEYELVGPSLE
jgi:GWxTD domain-containing protein